MIFPDRFAIFVFRVSRGVIVWFAFVNDSGISG